MSASEVPFVTIAEPSPRPGRRSGRRAGRHLRPVAPTRPARKRSPAVPVLVGTGIVIVALFGLAAMHALLISGQRQLDDVRRETAAEAEEVRRLRLQVAELEAPDRVLEAARTRLNMVDPGEVGYLLPAGVPVEQTEPIRVEAAEPPPPPTTVPAPAADDGEGADGASDQVSPEQEEVDGVLAGGEEPTTEADEGAAGTADAGTADAAANGPGGSGDTPAEGGPSEPGAGE